MTDPANTEPNTDSGSEPEPETDTADRPVLTTDEEAQTDDPLVDPGNS